MNRTANPEGEPISLSEFCRKFDNPEFHLNNHPAKRDLALFTIDSDLLLGRFPDGHVTGRFVAAHLNFCGDCKSIADEVEKRRKEFEI